MPGACLDYPLQKWLSLGTETSVHPEYIATDLTEVEFNADKPTTKLFGGAMRPTWKSLQIKKEASGLASLTFEKQRRNHQYK